MKIMDNRCSLLPLNGRKNTDFFSFETACPIVNFVKISVNWGQVVLMWLQVYHFCKKLRSAESPVIPTVFGLSKTSVVLWRSWHLQSHDTKKFRKKDVKRFIKKLKKVS